jgi:hypothetical protein
MLDRLNGTVQGKLVASYRRGKFTWNCRITADGFYTATFHNGRQGNVTYFSRDARDINNLIREELAKGFKMTFKA